jgi:hypothetical protein
MALLFVFYTLQMLLSEVGLSNTVAQITRLEPLERNNQGSSLIISGDIPQFFSSKPPPSKFNFSVRLGAPVTRGFLSCVVYRGPNNATGATPVINIIVVDNSVS